MWRCANAWHFVSLLLCYIVLRTTFFSFWGYMETLFFSYFEVTAVLTTDLLSVWSHTATVFARWPQYKKQLTFRPSGGRWRPYSLGTPGRRQQSPLSRWSRCPRAERSSAGTEASQTEETDEAVLSQIRHSNKERNIYPWYVTRSWCTSCTIALPPSLFWLLQEYCCGDHNGEFLSPPFTWWNSKFMLQK